MERERAFFGPYRLLRRLGGGGAGEVYLAEGAQPGQDGRQVAIKILRATADNPMSQAVGRDVTRVAALDEKHIIPYRDVVADGSSLGVVMAYAPGGSLGDEIHQADLVPLPLAPAIVARIVSQLARALSAAHAAGITHGDLKPSNIFVRTSSQGAPIATVSDFGQAFLTPLANERAANERGEQNQWALDQLRFAAPEQLQGAALPATDQYALAAIAYYLLTGSHVFSGTARQLLSAIARDPIPPPSALNPAQNSRVDRVLQRALAKQPEQRFPSVQAFADAFTEAIGALDQGASVSGSSRVAPRPQTQLAEAQGEFDMGADDLPADPPRPVRRWLLVLASGAVLAALLTCLLSWRLVGGGSGSLQLQGNIQRFLGPNSVATATPADVDDATARASEAQLQAALAGALLFSDPLTTNSQGWKTQNPSSFFASDGLHIVNQTTSEAPLLAAPKPSTPLTSAVIRAKITMVKGAADDLAGVCFLSRTDSAGKQFYCYFASSEGRYELWYYNARSQTGHWQFLNSGYSSNLKTGIGQTNELAALTNVSDNTVTLFANGKYVGKSSLAAGGPTAGGSGLLVLNRGAEAAFTQFAIYAATQ